MKIEPQGEHQWLQKLIGEWTYETEAPPKPDAASQKCTGTERVRPIGSLWVVAEGEGVMPGCGAVTTLMTLGYDPARKRYAGTWIGSMMSHLWIYDGWLNETATVLTLESEGPSMAGDGTMAKYRDIIDLQNDDHRLLRTQVLGDGGEWREFMVASYRRT